MASTCGRFKYTDERCNHLELLKIFVCLDNVGAGEREARIVSELVARRHFRWVHLWGCLGREPRITHCCTIG